MMNFYENVLKKVKMHDLTTSLMNFLSKSGDSITAIQDITDNEENRKFQANTRNLSSKPVMIFSRNPMKRKPTVIPPNKTLGLTIHQTFFFPYILVVR